MQKKAHDINSIAELIDVLGDDATLGDELGITQEAVANWRLRSCIPPGWHLRLMTRLQALGKSVSPRVFA